MRNSRTGRAARRALAVFAAVAAVAACAGTAVVSNSYIDASYRPLEWAGTGLIPVVVVGNPFPEPQAAFDDAVVAALGAAANDGAPRLVAAPAGSAAAYRVVISFGGGAAGDPQCRAARALPSPPAASPADRVSVAASLCRGARAITSADGSVGAVGGPKGEDFRRGLGQFASSLFPPWNPELNEPGA